MITFAYCFKTPPEAVEAFPRRGKPLCACKALNTPQPLRKKLLIPEVPDYDKWDYDKWNSARLWGDEEGAINAPALSSRTKTYFDSIFKNKRCFGWCAVALRFELCEKKRAPERSAGGGQGAGPLAPREQSGVIYSWGKLFCQTTHR